MGTITTVKNGPAMIDGLPIVNAAKKVSLHITREDIRSAKRKQPDCCVVAQACKRELGALEARVHLSRCFLRLENKPKVWVRMHTPPALRNNIIAYDRGGRFEQGEFTFVPMQPSKATGKKQSKTASGKPKKNRLGTIHVMTGIRKGAMAR